MRVAQLDVENYFACMVDCEESPLEPGVFLVPAGCIEAEEPVVPEGHKAKWNNGWVIEKITVRELEYWENRLGKYPSYTEYLDGIVKGDQAQIDKYIADCLAVKAMYPKPQE
jgi:hypothetical protein